MALHYAGRCAMPDTIQIVTKDSFEKFVSRSLLPIMLVFYSQKYPSCKNLMETIQALEAKYRGSIQFGLVDADQQGELTGQLGIGGLPSILILNGGRLCANIGGNLPLSHYKHMLDRLLSENKPHKKGLFGFLKH